MQGKVSSYSLLIQLSYLYRNLSNCVSIYQKEILNVLDQHFLSPQRCCSRFPERRVWERPSSEQSRLYLQVLLMVSSPGSFHFFHTSSFLTFTRSLPGGLCFTPVPMCSGPHNVLFSPCLASLRVVLTFLLVWQRIWNYSLP